MTLYNVVDVAVPCPNCGQAYAYGFEINEGTKCRASLKLGDAIPWGKEEVPLGEWTTEGLGKCFKCGEFITATFQVKGTVVVSIEKVTLG